MKINLNYILVLSSFICFTVSCKHDSTVPEPVLASDLKYAEDTLVVESGSSMQSSVPSVSGTGPFTFSVSSDGGEDDYFSINSNGSIIVNASAEPGLYALTVAVSNEAGQKPFVGIVIVQVHATASVPKDLQYLPSTIQVVAGEGYTTAEPVISGGGPYVYTIQDNQEPSNILIASNGSISITNQLATGTYPISIQVENHIGISVFENVLTVHVGNEAFPPADLVYIPGSVTIREGEASTSVLPKLSGTVPFEFSISIHEGANENITIGQFGQIQTTNLLGQGKYTIDVTVRNPEGELTLYGAYTITVGETPKVSFQNDILPIMQASCASCHGPDAGLTDYTDWGNSKLYIVDVLDRIQLAPSESGFMPKNADPLTEAEINQIKQWEQDGFQE